MDNLLYVQDRFAWAAKSTKLPLINEFHYQQDSFDDVLTNGKFSARWTAIRNALFPAERSLASSFLTNKIKDWTCFQEHLDLDYQELHFYRQNPSTIHLDRYLDINELESLERLSLMDRFPKNSTHQNFFKDKTYLLLWKWRQLCCNLGFGTTDV